MKKKQLLSLVGAVAAVAILGGVAYFVSKGGFSQTQSKAGLATESILRQWKFNKPGQRGGWGLPGANAAAIDKNGVLVFNKLVKQPIVLSNTTNQARINISGKTSLRINLSFIPNQSSIRVKPLPTGLATTQEIKEPNNPLFNQASLTVTAKYTDSKNKTVTLGTQTIKTDLRGKFQELSFAFPTSQITKGDLNVAYPVAQETNTTQGGPADQRSGSSISAFSTIAVRGLSFEFGAVALPEEISVDSISIVQTIDVLPTATPTPAYKTSPGTPDRSNPIAPSGQPQ